MKTALKTVILTAALIATGCAREKRPPELNTFVPEGQVRRSQQFQAQMAANGAREDGILYAWHFDGKDLSPLGREKLDSIADADTLAPLNIYLDVKGDTFADRSKSVTAYMQDKGLAAAHVKVTEGINENATKPVTENLANYGKTDTGESQGAGTVGAGTEASSMISTK